MTKNLFIINCKDWTACGVHGGGCCARGLYGGKPSLGVCGICADRTAVNPNAPPRLTGVETVQDEPPATASRLPGDVVAYLIAKIGYAAGPGCDCKAFRKQMNAWGWTGCLFHRAEIVEWFVKQAKKYGRELSTEDAKGLVKAALRDLFFRPNGQTDDSEA